MIDDSISRVAGQLSILSRSYPLVRYRWHPNSEHHRRRDEPKEITFMKIIRAAAFFCSFLFALSAFAQSSGQGNSGQTGSTSGQTGMGQSSQTPTRDAQPGNTQSGTAQSGSQSGMGQPNNGAAPQPGPSDQPAMRAPDESEVQSRIDAQVKVLTEQLTLNNDQQAKARNILLDQHEQAMTIVRD